MKHYITLLTVLSFFLALPQTVPAQTPAEKPVRVLIVTGVDYPGHPWKIQSASILRELGASKNIEVQLSEDIEVLGTNHIFDFDVLMLNFKNYDPLKSEEQAQKNLVRFITEGGGLMYFHFTGGAFENWKEYERIVGRVWNQELRGHDPYQQFTVDIRQKNHPVMRGISAFPITDELYTCLDGKREIDILATAKSSVDGKDYPMAFSFTEGKGRGFYTPLGHDARAFESPQLGQMLRNAAMWCAKRENLITLAPATIKAAEPHEARLKETVDTLPEGAKLLAYLDCGGPGKLEQGLKITLLEGAKPSDGTKPPEEVRTWRWETDAPIDGIPPQQMTVLFHSQQVPFSIEGLDRAKRYQLNVVWWDFDANGRTQSLIVQSPDQAMTKILRPGTSLPDYKESQLPPRTLTVALPVAFVREGKLLLNVRNESGPNAVINEIWINELQ
jgi:type 1 glutamine amidotransferase